MNMQNRLIKTAGVLGLCIWFSAAVSSTLEETHLERAYGDEAFISIATGARQLLSQAPAVASVITAADIRAMGATDLDQVLAAVPGLHVSTSPRAYSPLYSIRGIYSESNPQVLVLVNDIPITNVYVGDRGQVWGGMPINNISRIEVIRGPGSALYGADAFAGTINIITKSSEEIGGTQVGARGGSFDTGEGWLLHGSQWQGFDIAFALEAGTTSGHDGIIAADAQTAFDATITSASLAPGSVNLDRDWLDARIDLSRGPWRLRLGHQARDIGTGAGAALALDPRGSGTAHRSNVDLTYSAPLAHYWDITGTLSFLDTNTETDLVLYPPGAFGFAEGVIGSPQVYERHTRLALSAFYHGFDRHQVRIGAGASHNDMHKVREFKNYVQALPPTLFAPLLPDGSVADVSADPTQVFIRPNDRKVFYVFVQDEWSIAPAWRLTTGIRYDHYSDFGDTTNPRIALVWQAAHDLTTKLMYGRAFRAPSFSELYNINNPLAIGNKKLQPETIDTYELALRYAPSYWFDIGVNLYNYHMSDVIRFSPNTGVAENFGTVEGRGFEVETRISPIDSLSVSANYAYQWSKDKDSGDVIANTPRNLLYMLASWRPVHNVSMNMRLSWVANRARDVGDARPAPDDYAITDVTIRYNPSDWPWSFAASVRNLFDEKAVEPSPRMLGPGIPMIPGDLPLAERSFFVEANYRFR
ncbi:MAG: TonB-dependent receptor [Gammaproteobacteria bacterium]|jgi:iron complex outermembrane receptor protein|nr:TonB-dependent receptor [Gammaproteobacteria bacterium]